MSTKTKEQGFTKRQQQAMFDLLVRARRVACVRVQVNPSAPTCRSPVKSERLPRQNWCLYCEAREFVEGPVS